MPCDQAFQELGNKFYSLKLTKHGYEALSCFINEDKPGEDGGRIRVEAPTAKEALESLNTKVQEFYAQKA